MKVIIRNMLKWILIPTTALSMVACQSVQTTQAGVVGVDRKQMMVVSSDDMNKAATQEYAKLIEQESCPSSKSAHHRQ